MKLKTITILIAAALTTAFHPLDAAEKPASSEPEFTAFIYNMSGDVSLKLAGKNEWLKAKEQAGLTAGDTVRTGADSSAEILFESGAILKILQLAEVKLNTISFSKNKTEIEIPGKGEIISKFAGRKKSTFSVKTRDCAATIRGTGYSVSASDGQTDIILVEGNLTVKDFVEESAVPRENNELLLAVLHEVRLKPQYSVTVKKDGLGKPVKIAKEVFEEKKKQVDALKEEYAKAKAEWDRTDIMGRSKEREKVRESMR